MKKKRELKKLIEKKNMKKKYSEKGENEK